MNKTYTDPTRNIAAVLMDKANSALKEILVAMKPAIAALVTDKAYVALQSGVLTGTPEDFGIVRWAADFRHVLSANPDYLRIPEDERDNYAPYFEKERYVQVSINIPKQCQIRVTVNVNSNGSFDLNTFRTDVDGALATLTYVDVMNTIALVKAASPLTAPQLVEKLS